MNDDWTPKEQAHACANEVIVTTMAWRDRFSEDCQAAGIDVPTDAEANLLMEPLLFGVILCERRARRIFSNADYEAFRRELSRHVLWWFTTVESAPGRRLGFMPGASFHAYVDEEEEGPILPPKEGQIEILADDGTPFSRPFTKQHKELKAGYFYWLNIRREQFEYVQRRYFFRYFLLGVFAASLIGSIWFAETNIGGSSCGCARG